MKELKIGQSSGNLIKSVNTGAVIVNFVTYEGESCLLGRHYHVNPHFSYIFKGQDIERKNKIEHTRLAGQIFSYEAGEPHQTLYRKEPTQNIVIEISKKFIQRFSLKDDHFGSNINHDQINILMANFLKSINLKSDNNEIEFLVLEIINPKSDIIHDSNPIWTKIVRQNLYDNWNANIDLEELSKLTGLHPVTISKNFKHYFKYNLAEYRRRIKVERSLSLLKNSKASLTEIAYECGFSDQSHFIRIFKDVTNFLPYEFRNLNLH